jgi:hypothetical protein
MQPCEKVFFARNECQVKMCKKSLYFKRLRD